MMTRKDVLMRVAGLVGDPYLDWLTPEYFSPLVNQVYDEAIQYLEGTCAPYIEKLVMVPSVQVGIDENNIVPFGVTSGGGAEKTYPLKRLVKPRYIEFKTAGAPNYRYHPAKEVSILPDGLQQVTPAVYDIRVRGDFKPQELTTDDSLVEVHPNGGYALAYSVAAVIGMERPNQGWVQNYGPRAQDAWDQIAADITRQQQHLSFRLGSPNRMNDRRSYNWNLQSSLCWEWRSYGLYLKLC